MPAASLRALLERSIDYAGLFPPASLSLEPALQNQAQYVRSPDVWMLGAFILPVGQFNAAAEHLAQFDERHPLNVSALGPKTENASAFVDAVNSAVAGIHALIEKHAGRVSVTQLEMPLSPDPDVPLLARARETLGPLLAFWEAPAANAEQAITMISDHNKSTELRPFGFKLRTGGVTADAFPTSREVAAALVAAAHHRVPIKFTAGLHHPVRQFHESVQTKMHGFLNVLGAGVLAAEHGWDQAQTVAMLDDEEPGSFSFSDDSFSWREWSISAARIRARRELVTSLGSCSFDEPREDLRHLQLL
ncbi:MAG: hypothetical protein H0V56_06825 [Chthoniobacterales bacterium]|nr:hypothetical protein [Chthoniobacterales bacterium]